MNTFNLFQETIKVAQVDFINAVNSNKTFGITHEGVIEYAPFSHYPYIYQGTVSRKIVSSKPTPITETLGKYYSISIEGPMLEIKASSAWQDILTINISSADYDDSTGDGVSEFADKAMEDMGWHASDFDIDYRSMVEHLEAHVDGMLFCIEREEPSYQFSGLGYFEDIEHARRVLNDFCVSKITDKIANDDDYAIADLDEDQLKALAFFKLLV